MDEQLRVRVGGARPGHIGRRNDHMPRAAAVVERKLLFGQLRSHIAAKVRVRNKQDLISIKRTADVDGAGGGHADIALGFQRRGRVDVGHCGVAGVLRLQRPQRGQVQLLGHRAAGHRVCQPDGLFRAEDLAGLGHKPHTAHDDARRIGLGGLHAQPVGVAGVVGDLQHGLALVGVGQDADIFLFLQAQDLLLQLMRCHTVQPLSLYTACYFSHGCSGARKPCSCSSFSIRSSRSGVAASTRW